MSEPKRVLIVGGVAGGASAAARARRLSEDARIILFERGADISFANCGLPYHIGGVIPDRKRLLVTTAQAMRMRFNIDVRTRTEVVRIDAARKQLVARDLATGRESAEPYDVLILSPGAEPVRPPIPGADSPRVFTLRSLGDMDAIKKVIDDRKPRHAVVIGGGYVGLEMAEALRARNIGVTLVELSSQVFPPIDPEMAAPIHQHLKLHGVDLRLGTSVTAVQEGPDGLEVRLSTGQCVTCGLAVMAIGVRPDVRLAREAGLTIGPTGGIAVDEHMRTSDPNIFAVGDAVEVADFITGRPALYPLAGPANRQGRIAADNALGRETVYRRTQGTAICKVFDLAVGITGQSEKALQKAGRAYEKVYVHPASHAGYYPGASPISLKLIFEPDTGKILGAQGVGISGVDKRIDVLAVAIRAGLTVMDLENLELSYAPPYGSARDVINYAGFVAANVLRGDVKLFHTPQALAPREDQLLLDVRAPAEVEAGTIPGAVNIPVDELRARLGELPRDKELLVFCQVGLRGYLACRILSQKGFRCRNLTGGYKTFQCASAGAVAASCAATSQTSKQEMKDDTGAGTGQPQANSAERQASSERPADAGTGLPLGAVAAATKPQVKTEAVKTMTEEIVKRVDATALQCPGPIMRLRQELDAIADGQALTIAAADPAFPADAAAWCHSTGNELLEVARNNGHFVATVRRAARAAHAAAPEAAASEMARRKSIIVFSGDFDKVMAAFIIANGAAAMGSEVTMFFTFWGLNALRKPAGAKVRKTFIERMFGWMMPRGADELALSKMHMAGMGLAMIKGIMRKKNVASLPELIASARAAGVKLVACTMSMDLMGIKREELIEGIEEGGVAMYLDRAEAGNVNLFI
ncbi:MAG: FAD-dependent oxidoreductase [Phycisphaerae bacterium]